MFLKIAWLNIWCNKRRTLITATSVFFAVLLAILTRSVTDGIYENMIRNIVSYSSGYLQVHQEGYWEEQSIDNTFESNPELDQNLLNERGVIQIMPRLESFALASYQDKTKGVMILGVDPKKEKSVNNLHEKITEGRFLKNLKENAVVIGEGLAAHLHLKINDSLVLLGQGFHASSAAGKYLVKGIISMGSPELNDNIVYMPLKQAQFMYGAENRLTAISIMLNKTADLKEMKSKLEAGIDTERYEIMTWKEMMPEIDQFIEADSTGHLIIIGILYLIISFGLFGTLLMMTFERLREFGILIAIGMKKHLLALILLLESIMISLIGCFFGIIGAGLLIRWFTEHPIYFTGELKEVYQTYGIDPIIFFSEDHRIFIIQASIVLFLSVILALYPGIKVMKLKPIDAINS